MSNATHTAKNLWRQIGSIGCAVRSKIAAKTIGRNPTKTCQVPDLEHLMNRSLSSLDHGSFVEVGAFDGERFSNTSWLADRGWKGIYVEASQEYAQLCKLRHTFNDVTVLNCAAGEAEGEAVLTQLGALSTLSTDTLEEYERIPWAEAQIKKRGGSEHATKIRTLDSILESNGCCPGFEVLVVDVEGFEEQVFKGFTLSRWMPRMLIVELCDVHPDFANNTQLVDSAARVRRAIFEAGYSESYRDEINTVFEIAADGKARNAA